MNKPMHDSPVGSRRHSDRLFEIAESVIPGAGLGSYALAQDVRLIYSHGLGSRIWDVDGREYIDYVGGAGALILGHSHPAVIQASKDQLECGAHMFGSLNDVAITLAERLVNDIPCAEKLIYATTGSEATAYAMRLARAFTGREKILKFEGAYHGNHDYAVVSCFPRESGDYPQGIADYSGQPAATTSTMLVCPFNDLDTLGRVVAENKNEIAAVIAEPVQRIIPAKPEFLRGIQKLCRDNDIVFILDEVVTGFRLSYAGGQGWYGIQPDLAAFGKIVGGGGPMSCVAGRADILDLADPDCRGRPGYTYINGTLHGNPVAAAATLAVLDELSQPGIYERMNAYTEELCMACQQVLKKYKIDAVAEWTGSLWQILFMDRSPVSVVDILASNQDAMRRLDTELLKQGQYVLPGVRRFVSAVHTVQDIEDTVRGLDEACRVFNKSG